MSEGRNLASPSPKELQPLTVALLECVTPRDVARVIVERGIAVLEAEAGLVALVAENRTELEVLIGHGYADGVEQRWRRFPIDANLPLSNVVRLGVPLFVATRAEWEELFPGLRSERTRETKATVDLPLMEGGQAIGALHFSFGQERGFDKTERDFATELARQCALAMGRALARQHAELVQRRMVFLVRASAVLNETLAFEKTLHDLAHLVTPELSDYAQVAIVNSNGAVERIAVAHESPEREAIIHEFYTCYPPDPAMPSPITTAIATGQIQHIQEITDEMFQKAATNAHHLSLLRQLALTSTLTIPLITREKTLGAMTFAMSSESGRDFRPDLIDFLQELAGRAASAIENARLYADAKREIDQRMAAEAEREHAVRQREAVLIENARLVQESANLSQQQRDFHANVLSSITDGRLVLCETPNDLPRALECKETRLSITTSESIPMLRAATVNIAKKCFFPQERVSDLLTAVSEAAMNAFVHAGGGEASVFTSDDGDCIQIWITDRGKGIEYSRLPEAMFRKGYSSAGTLGHGFKMILMFADYVYVMTSPTGTTVVIKQYRDKPGPSWALTP
ncbi:MAG: multi-sensor signal transduction histidine kinase [Capsulimonas sp.]|nr:multi-sensor signal transduction histidine kinase [Capsulimonas sp.]